jgi:hypothetical protein
MCCATATSRWGVVGYISRDLIQNLSWILGYLANCGGGAVVSAGLQRVTTRRIL